MTGVNPPDSPLGYQPRDTPLYGPPAAPVSPLPPARPAYQPAAARKDRTWLYVGLAAIVVVLLAAVGLGVFALAGGHKPGQSAAPAATSNVDAQPPAAVTEAPSPPAEHPPAPGDFTINVKVLSKECFGSAGCNVGFRIEVGYNGEALTNTYKVTYTLHGADEPFIGSFDFDYASHQITTESENLVSTKTSKAVLTATATDVLED